MRVRAVGLSLVLAMSGVATPHAQTEEAERVVTAKRVVDEVMRASDSAIPAAVFENADAIAIFPSTFKAGFIFGGHRGRGVISVRDDGARTWSTPAFLTLTGGSFGFQIGAQSVDVVMVIMNRAGLEKLLENEFKIGGDASAVVGPLGRDLEASTDILLQAEILSYSRNRGLFAGVSLKGATIRSDQDANERFYGRRLDSKQIVLEGQGGHTRYADVVSDLQATLAKYAP
jgi:lipid-binding SYLF domain-containing protein